MPAARTRQEGQHPPEAFLLRRPPDGRGHHLRPVRLRAGTAVPGAGGSSGASRPKPCALWPRPPEGALRGRGSRSVQWPCPPPYTPHVLIPAKRGGLPPVQRQRRLHVRTLCVQRGLVSAVPSMPAGLPLGPRTCLTRRGHPLLGASRSKHFELLRPTGYSWKDVQESGQRAVGAGAWDRPGRETVHVIPFVF